MLHDLVARSRLVDDHFEICTHGDDFSTEAGRRWYRYRINRLLEDHELAYRLATEGEDVGRLVAVGAEGRAELATISAARSDAGTGDRVRHALAQFRARDATEHDKRSAIITLVGVLEERRKLLKAELFSKDEDALFEIANRHAIHHQSESQKGDYDPIYLDWVFWWYLATIELTDRLAARQTGREPTLAMAVVSDGSTTTGRTTSRSPRGRHPRTLQPALIDPRAARDPSAAELPLGRGRVERLVPGQRATTAAGPRSP